MPEEIDVACPGCNAIFGVPKEFCGETAECAECGAMFEIPHMDESNDGNLESTKTGAIQGVESDDMGEATNTVRLSRTGIGMIPQVKDKFQVTDTPAPAAPRPAPRPAATAPAPRPAAPPKTPTTPQAPSAAPQTPSESATSETGNKKVIIPSWISVRMKKGEEVIGVRESTSPATTNAILIAIPAIIAGGIGMAQGAIGLPATAGGVGVIAIATFITAMLMGKSNSKKALIVTTQRSISINGKSRMEVKQ